MNNMYRHIRWAIPLQNNFFGQLFRPILLWMAVLLPLVVVPRWPASAATFTVNITADAPDANPGDGICETAPGNSSCSLRAAIMESNALTEANIIVLPAGTYLLTRTGSGPENGDLDITSDLDIQGAGAAVTIIDGNGPVINQRVMEVHEEAVVAISGVTIRNGQDGELGGGGILARSFSSLTLSSVTLADNSSTSGGGGILTTGSLIVHNSLLDNNQTVPGLGSVSGGALFVVDTAVIHNSVFTNNSSSRGGAIHVSSGQLSLTNSTISGNEATLEGGGLSTAGALTLFNSTVSGNQARNGGGLAVRDGGSLTLLNSTVSGNQATESGGGIHNLGSSSLYNGVIAANDADSDLNNTGNGGGIFIGAGAVSVRNTLIGDNRDLSPLITSRHHDCSGSLISQRHNLVESVLGCTITGDSVGNIVGQDPLLAALQDNGGPTLTHALLAGSPAIDAGNPTGCRDAAGDIIANDQRGFIRPVDGSGNGVARCDMGAFEFASPGPPTPTPTVTPTATPTVTPTATAVPSPTATPTPPPGGVTIVVDTDEDDLSNNGNCSLREAIIAANNNTPVDGCPAGSTTGQDTILLPAGNYLLTREGEDEDLAVAGDLDIRGHLSLIGEGAAVTLIDGNQMDRVFHIFEGAVVEMAQLTIGNGRTEAQFGGAGILNIGGRLTLSHTVLRDGQAGQGFGGGITNFNGVLTINDSEIRGHSAQAAAGLININGHVLLNRSTIRDNTAEAAGGGIFNAGALATASTITILNSTVSGNHGFSGGGIINDAEDELTIVNSTISGNTAVNDGGGLHNLGVAHLHNVTLTGNRADAAGNGSGLGGGVSNDEDAVLNMANTIIAGNQLSNLGSRPGEDCAGALHSLGHNLVQTEEGCLLSGDLTGNILGQNPLLAPLQGNGGPTHTHSLLAGSPAIDAGDPDGCKDQNGSVLDSDQRGFNRPADGGSGLRCDMGAFEFNASPEPTPAPSEAIFLPLVIR